jgi:thiamine transport system permease protein
VTPARIASVRRRLAVTVALLSTLVIVATPLAAMLERSLAVGDGYGIAHYRALFASGTITGVYVPVRDAIANSLTYAVAATVIAVTVGGLASVVVVYGRRSVGRVFDAGLMLPLGTSAVTIGFGIVIALDEPPLDLRSSRLIVPVAQALVAIPFVMRTLVPTLRAVDPRLRDAASVLGATPARMRAEIDLRFALRALLVGAAFAFANSLGDFGATSFLARVDAPTVPVAMFRLLGQPGTARRGQAMALGVILALLTASAVLVIERLRPADSLGW